MPSRPHNMPEQEHSIKERANELFVESSGPEVSTKPTKPFAVYLRETPAQPLSPLTKTVFWILGIVVAVLFLAALWRITHRHRARPRPARPPAEVATFPSRGRSSALLAYEPVRDLSPTAPAAEPPAPPGVIRYKRTP
jgi:hypothetical protein